MSVEHPPQPGATDPDAQRQHRLAAARSTASKPGFVVGLRSLLDGAGCLLEEPRSWPLALIPALILVLSVTTGIFAAIHWIHPWLSPSESAAAGFWLRFGGQLLAWLGTGLAALLGVLAAVLLTPALAAPALERLVRLQEQRLGLRERPALGFFRELLCGFRSQLFALALSAPVLLVLLGIDLLFPAAAFVTVPLKLLVTALSVAWNLLDYPLTLAGVRIRDRLRIISSYARATLGFGVAFAALFWIPCFGILALPVGVTAATRLLARFAEHDPILVQGYQRSG